MRNICNYLTIFFLALTTLNIANAEGPPVPGPLSFVMIQNEFVFDRSNVKMAKIELDRNGEYRGLHIQLKQSAIEAFTQTTEKGKGLLAALILDKRVIASFTIRSPLSGDFLMNIPKVEAENFLKQLAVQKPPASPG